VDVLIISHLEDIHSRSVAKEVDRLGGRARIVNNASIPGSGMLTYEIDPTGSRTFLRNAQGEEVNFASLRGVWWRRPEKYEFGDTIVHPTIRAFAAAEWNQLLSGALASGNWTFVNSITNSRLAVLKPLQLQRARAHGLMIPRT
jgi:hypothetical protein